MSRRVLFATSNGTGLGHLNRAMAIARRLPDEVEPAFFTLSQAAPVVAEQGYDVDYLASYRRPASGTDRAWNLRLRAVLERLLDERRFDLVVFDGVHPYRALTHVLSRRGAPPLALVPAGDVAGRLRRGAAAAGPAPSTPYSSPESWPRAPIAAPPSGGAPRRRGSIRSSSSIPRSCSTASGPRRSSASTPRGAPRSWRWARAGGSAGAAGARDQGAELAARTSRSPCCAPASPSVPSFPPGSSAIDGTFPMSRLHRAIDLAVAAPGYNAFHELIANAVPTLFVPMARETDDQDARARWADGAGAGLAVAGGDDGAMIAALEQISEPAVAERIRRRCREVWPGNGAGAAADLVAAMAHGEGRAPRTPPDRPAQPLAAALGPSRGPDAAPRPGAGRPRRSCATPSAALRA